ncbi:hypothetical protein CBW21_12810 [Chromobacterium violaceum]|uniref:Uncharacterized protein n=1 Tax=Chromobacterium violaceum TaxID=536 RepID=A0A202B8M2_CHRVL|nr:hypothetical protein CBW21_12810 [Chromobacterium violaceum]
MPAGSALDCASVQPGARIRASIVNAVGGGKARLTRRAAILIRRYGQIIDCLDVPATSARGGWLRMAGLLGAFAAEPLKIRESTICRGIIAGLA